MASKSKGSGLLGGGSDVGFGRSGGRPCGSAIGKGRVMPAVRTAVSMRFDGDLIRVWLDMKIIRKSIIQSQLGIILSARINLSNSLSLCEIQNVGR